MAKSTQIKMGIAFFDLFLVDLFGWSLWARCTHILMADSKVYLMKWWVSICDLFSTALVSTDLLKAGIDPSTLDLPLVNSKTTLSGFANFTLTWRQK